MLEAKKIGHRSSFTPGHRAQVDANHSMLGTHLTARLSGKNAYNLVKLSKLINTVKDDLVRIIQKFQQGEVDRSKTSYLIKKILKIGHENSYLLGMRSSGYDGSSIPKEDKSWVNYTRYDEHSYLDKFLDDIENDKGKISYTTRIQFYADSMRGTYNAGRNVYMPSNVLVYWRLESGKSPVTKKPVEHCSSCVELSKMSPFTPDTLPIVPRSNHTKCMTNCRCKLVYVHSDASTTDAIRKKYKSAKSVLTSLTRRGVIH